MAASGAKPVLPPVRGPLRAIGSVVLPSLHPLDEAGWREAEAIMEGALAPRPQGVKRQLRLFLRLANLLPVLRTGRTLQGLPPGRRATFLDGLQRSPLMLLRRGFWGVRTLLFMGYYAQDRVREGIGYGARLRGWTAKSSLNLESRTDEGLEGSRPGERRGS